MFMLIAMAAFVIFWVAWPRHAAIRFLVDRHNAPIEIANPFRAGTSEALDYERTKKPLIIQRIQRSQSRGLRLENLISHERTATDILLARQTFDFEMSSFTICRGEVVWGPKCFLDHAGGRSYY